MSRASTRKFVRPRGAGMVDWLRLETEAIYLLRQQGSEIVKDAKGDHIVEYAPVLNLSEFARELMERLKERKV